MQDSYVIFQNNNYHFFSFYHLQSDLVNQSAETAERSSLPTIVMNREVTVTSRPDCDFS